MHVVEEATPKLLQEVSLNSMRMQSISTKVIIKGLERYELHLIKAAERHTIARCTDKDYKSY
jgi:RNA 3'-terminal phosphate cyclase